MADYLSPDYADLLHGEGLESFAAFWDLEAAWVEPPNHDRGGWSGVVKLELQAREGRRVFFIKRQQNHLYRAAKHGFRKRPTLAREFEALTRLSTAGVPVPDVAFFGSRRHGGAAQAVLVIPELTGFKSIKAWIGQWQAEGWPDRQTRRRIAEAVAGAIAALHRQGWCHRALHDKHVFLMLDPSGEREPEVCLIDLEKARRAFLRRRAIVKDLGPLYRRTPQLETRDRLHFFKRYAKLAEVGAIQRPLMHTISAGGFHPVEEYRKPERIQPTP